MQSTPKRLPCCPSRRGSALDSTAIVLLSTSEIPVPVQLPQAVKRAVAPGDSLQSNWHGFQIKNWKHIKSTYPGPGSGADGSEAVAEGLDGVELMPATTPDYTRVRGLRRFRS